jgi:DNA N-6-adenine-methyltransferase (Dam)
MILTKPDAEEFSQSLEQIGEGWFRQLALGIKLGVPEALGLSRRQWADRIGVKVRDRAERINIEIELAAEGLSNRAIADVLGVGEATVRRDTAPNDAEGDPPPEDEEDTDAPNDAVKDARAFRTVWGAACPNNTGCNEWYTPAKHIELVRSVLGEIDLDPASHPFAQQTVRAAQFFTQDDDGLARPWVGRIFCNPPYSKGLITPFVDKLLAEISIGNVHQAILLTHNHSDTRWFQDVLGKASRVCLTAGRLGYYGPNGEVAAPVQGQAFHYFGENVERFEAVFSAIGTVLEPKAAP